MSETEIPLWPKIDLSPEARISFAATHAIAMPGEVYDLYKSMVGRIPNEESFAILHKAFTAGAHFGLKLNEPLP